MDELLNKVAELRGMPASLVLRSAEARAKSDGIPVEQVLAEWAGEPTPGAEEPAAVAPPAQDTADVVPSTPAEEAAAEPPAAVGAAVSLSKDELLEKAAEERGMPASLVERSAEARAKSEGVPVEQVLAEWAGVEAGAATEPAPAETVETAPPPVAEEPAAPEGEEAVPEAGAKIEVLEAAEPAPVDEEPEAAEQDQAAARSSYPVLLSVGLVLVPLIAVLYILAIPNGPSCGSSGQLAIDPVSGEAVGCDGNPYGEEVGGNFAAGETLYASLCAACHGATGGGGAGPAMAGGAVLGTFPSGQCSPHLQWVTLGSSGWQTEVGNTYGANDSPVNGGMPAFGGQLDEEQLAQVVLYERVAFGGEDLGEAELGCFAEGEDVAALGD